MKRKSKIRYSSHFLAQQRGPSEKQNWLTHYYSTYLRSLEGFLGTMITTQEDHTRSTLSLVHYQITCKIKMLSGCRKKKQKKKHLLSQV